MNRHFYISNDLNDLEQIELELEQEGISAAHSHVLSLDDAEVAAHPSLNEVEAVLRTDEYQSGRSCRSHCCNTDDLRCCSNGLGRKSYLGTIYFPRNCHVGILYLGVWFYWYTTKKQSIFAL